MLETRNITASIVVDVSAQDTGHRTRGIGRYAVELWRALDNLGEGVVPLRLSDAAGSWRADVTPRHFRRFMQAQLRMHRELARTSCRVFGATEPWLLPRSTASVAVVPTCHDVIPLEFAAHYTGWASSKWDVYFRWLRASGALNRCPRIIAPSEATRVALGEYLNVDTERVVVVPHGVDHGRFWVPQADDIEAMRATYRLGQEPYIVYLGGYDYRKNIPALVRGFARSQRRRDALLVLAGGATPRERVEIGDVAHAEGVTDRVVWTGRIADEHLPALYGGALALGYPSLSEGFGLQLLEAMACGCPVITSDRSALREVAEGVGVLVDPTDDDAIAAALDALDDDGATQMRAAGIARAATYDWARTARQTLEVYRSVS